MKFPKVLSNKFLEALLQEIPKTLLGNFKINFPAKLNKKSKRYDGGNYNASSSFWCNVSICEFCNGILKLKSDVLEFLKEI